mmetsp:Transcript_6591/g.13321  ORF Transcript_6591/g.13321 Transcript_6591/m.13321 type:complete len:202 (-) Transcript_6591:199-804(-)
MSGCRTHTRTGGVSHDPPTPPAPHKDEPVIVHSVHKILPGLLRFIALVLLHNLHRPLPHPTRSGSGRAVARQRRVKPYRFLGMRESHPISRSSFLPIPVLPSSVLTLVFAPKISRQIPQIQLILIQNLFHSRRALEHNSYKPRPTSFSLIAPQTPHPYRLYPIRIKPIHSPTSSHVFLRHSGLHVCHKHGIFGSPLMPPKI